MIKKLFKGFKFYFVIVLVGLFLTPYAWTAPPSEFFVPAPLEPQLSGDGKTLYNAVPPVVYVYDPTPPDQLVRIPAPNSLLSLPESASAAFSITYVANGGQDPWGETCYTFPDAVKPAFNAAANVWANLLRSSVPITINACWANLGSVNTLGYSGGGTLQINFPGTLRGNTWYAGSLANALAGFDLAPSQFDMNITFNRNFPWYYGTDGNTPSGQVDLMTVVLHEIGHGLNISGSMTYSGGQGSWGYNSGYPNIYDTFIRDGSYNLLLNTGIYGNPSGALGSVLTSNDLWFTGSNAMAANGGQKVKIYAPSTWATGTSYSHLDYNTFKNTANALMIYAIPSGKSIHDPGPVALGILMDMGWGSSGTCTYSISPTSQSFSSAGGTGRVTVTAPGGCSWTATENLDWVSITSGASGTGTGTVTYSISPYAGSGQRVGTVSVADQTFTVTQFCCGIMPVYRFFDTIGGGHFYTIDEAEKNTVIQNYKWFRFEGVGFYAYPVQQPGTLPVYRFFDTIGGGHFYTIDEAEKNTVIQNYKWFRFEGVGFYAYPVQQPGTLPVYRFFDTIGGGHFYTIDEAEKNTVIQNYKWFRPEGVGFYAFPGP